MKVGVFFIVIFETIFAIASNLMCNLVKRIYEEMCICAIIYLKQNIQNAIGFVIGEDSAYYGDDLYMSANRRNG